jgi:ketosteroid isomerase-like protein
MTKMSLLCLVLVLMAVTARAQSGDQKIRNGIEKVMNDQVAAWNAGDIEGFMKGYWNSPEMRFVSGDNVARGWQAALDRYNKTYDTRAKMGVLTFSGLEITVLSKKSAVVLGSWALKRDVDNPKGKFTLIFRKFKDGWKIVHDHTS